MSGRLLLGMWLTVAPACVLNDIDLAQKRECPCAPGYMCSDDVCVRQVRTAGDAASGDAETGLDAGAEVDP